MNKKPKKIAYLLNSTNPHQILNKWHTFSRIFHFDQNPIEHLKNGISYSSKNIVYFKKA